MTRLNRTHAPELRSWVHGANGADSDFPIQNLPYAVFRRRGSDEAWRGGVAIGAQIVDLDALLRSGVIRSAESAALKLAAQSTLNAFMAAGTCAWSQLRLQLSDLLAENAPNQREVAGCLVDQAQAEFRVPAQIGDYTDFYTSIHHATTVGRQFRPDNPLLPNYKWIPIGYHGRASSVIVSGQDFRRPCGQTMPQGCDVPQFGPSRRLDYELELGAFVGPGNALGDAIGIDEAESQLFGLCLLNDWSARDLQGWEYQPLGPFLSKSFATTISPWIVSMEALAPFRVPFERPAGDPQPLAYLDSAFNRRLGAIDIELSVVIESAAMRTAGVPAAPLSRSNYRHAYWTLAQMLTHHSVNGCGLQPGDLMGTGTLSGPEPGSAGSLLELSQAGKAPITLAGGEQRSFLQDGDRVILRGWCERAGATRIGFGEASAQVLPARVL